MNQEQLEALYRLVPLHTKSEELPREQLSLSAMESQMAVCLRALLLGKDKADYDEATKIVAPSISPFILNSLRYHSQDTVTIHGPLTAWEVYSYLRQQMQLSLFLENHQGLNPA